MTQDKNRDLLLRAEEALKAAIERNKASYKNFERLSDVYYRLAQISAPQEKTDWLNQALNAASLAIARYPGCGRLHFKQAQIAEQLGKTKAAIEQYKQAVEIEDQYRAQFRQMYPEREKVISRLREDQYKLAKDKLKALEKLTLSEASIDH